MRKAPDRDKIRKVRSAGEEEKEEFDMEGTTGESQLFLIDQRKGLCVRGV